MQSHRMEPIELPGGFVVDLRRRELRGATGERVALRPQAFAVLLHLAERVDELVDKDELVRAAWPGVIVTDDSLVQCIKLIRDALDDDERRIVQTEPKRGYRLVAATAGEEDTQHPFHQDIRFATSSDGVRIAYATSGDSGPPLVRATHWMVHLEWDWQNLVYGPWIQGLSRRYRLLRYDGRGCGLSDRGIPMGTLDDEVRDLEAVVDAAGLDRFALFGRSQGGAISIRYAARHPERVSRLVLEGSFALGWTKRGPPAPDPDQVRAFYQLIEHGWGNNNDAFHQLIASEMFPGASAEQRQAFNTMQRMACTPRDAARLGRMAAEYDASADLPRVRCPTLVLHNPNDGCVPFEQGRLIASSIHGARLRALCRPQPHAAARRTGVRRGQPAARRIPAAGGARAPAARCAAAHRIARRRHRRAPEAKTRTLLKPRSEIFGGPSPNDQDIGGPGHYRAFAQRSTQRYAMRLATAALSSAALATSVASVNAQELLVRIGHVAPLSGGMAAYGLDSENGVRMAIEELNARGATIGGQEGALRAAVRG